MAKKLTNFDDSPATQGKLAEFRDSLELNLKNPKKSKLSDLCIANFNPIDKYIFLIQAAGKRQQFLGYTANGGRCLHPEEAIFLQDMGHLELRCNDVSLSLQESMKLVLQGCDVTIDKYIIYKHLMQLGYYVVRTRIGDYFHERTNQTSCASNYSQNNSSHDSKDVKSESNSPKIKAMDFSNIAFPDIGTQKTMRIEKPKQTFIPIKDPLPHQSKKWHLDLQKLNFDEPKIACDRNYNRQKRRMEFYRKNNWVFMPSQILLNSISWSDYKKQKEDYLLKYCKSNARTLKSGSYTNSQSCRSKSGDNVNFVTSNNVTNRLVPIYDVHLQDSGFTYNSRRLPDFRVVLLKSRDCIPSVEIMKFTQSLYKDSVELLLAINQFGTVSFMKLHANHSLVETLLH